LHGLFAPFQESARLFRDVAADEGQIDDVATAGHVVEPNQHPQRVMGERGEDIEAQARNQVGRM
jgi:hypothetical protein